MSHAQQDESLIVPPGYLILTSPNRPEDLSFSCPHEGCDGLVFALAETCILHERDWHSPPYECAECGAKFAAATALRRHARASNHKSEWVCQEAECQDLGMEFTSKGTYVKHAFSSPAHEERVQVDCIVVGDADDSHQNSATEEADEPDYICHEACCYYYGTDFHCKSEWARHSKSSSHIGACAIGEATRARLPPGEALDEEQLAIRTLRCSEAACPKYDDVFNTPRGYFNHLKKSEHLTGSAGSLGATVKPAMSDADQETDEINLRCREEHCPRYGRHFLSRTGYKMHVNSTSHMKASGASDTPHTADPFSTPTENFTTSFLSPIDGPSLPNEMTPGSPSTGRGPGMSGNAPRKNALSRITTMRASPAARRERELELRNQELEKRVERLEEKYDKIRKVLESISDLTLDD